MGQVVDTSDFRPGLKIRWEGGMWVILECSHHKMGRGGAIVRGIFDGCERIPVTYIGGTFKAGDLILEPLAAALPRNCELVPPRFEPDRGAVLILQSRLQK